MGDSTFLLRIDGKLPFYVSRHHQERMDFALTDSTWATVYADSDAERSIRDAVGHARQAGMSWALIGSLIGTSGEAARQRYGQAHKSRR